jgi:hypothetical protein
MIYDRLKKIFGRIPHPANSAVFPSCPPGIGRYTFESLWDDFERRTSPYEISFNDSAGTPARLLYWMGSINQCGYTREKCLRALISDYAPGDENRILLRLADWVPQVKAVARDWALRKFRDLPLDAIMANQRLLLYLSRKERVRNDPGFAEITRDLLHRTHSMERGQFFAFDAMFRRFLFVESLLDDEHLRSWILDDPNPFNRLLLLSQRTLSDLKSDEMDRLEADRSVFVRRRYFYARLNSGTTPSKESLLSLALDPNLSLRNLGQFFLDRLYQVDAHAIYLSLPDDRFFYIADYARKEDSDHFLKGARLGSPSIRTACIKALAGSAPDRLEELDVRSLVSGNRKVRAALTPVLPRVLSVEKILSLRAEFEASSSCGIIGFLRLLERASFWAFVDTGLDILLSRPSGDVHLFVTDTIATKVAIYETLSTVRQESIEKKIERLRYDCDQRNEGLARMVEFAMGLRPITPGER